MRCGRGEEDEVGTLFVGVTGYFDLNSRRWVSGLWLANEAGRGGDWSRWCPCTRGRVWCSAAQGGVRAVSIRAVSKLFTINGGATP